MNRGVLFSSPMATAIDLKRPDHVLWTQKLPGSKSLTNRALLFAAIARGQSTIHGWLDAEDSTHMRTCLNRVGVSITNAEHGSLAIHGVGGCLPVIEPAPELFVGTAGTVARFLLAVAAASPGLVHMDGTPRMRERPMDQLVDALREQGAQIVSTEQHGFLPMKIGPNLEGLRGGDVRLARPASSQFVSGLVIAGMLARKPTRIILEQGSPARPYIDMTLQVLHRFGGDANWCNEHTIETRPSILRGCSYDVEPDASAASYPLTLAAIYGGKTTIDGLGTQSLQGDVAFARILEQMGANIEQGPDYTTVEGAGQLRGGSFDLSDMPDMTLTLAVAALFATRPTTIRGVAILRHHESDRLAAGATELRKLGATVHEHEDGLTIEPPSQIRPGVNIETYKDHRMAMAFAMVGNVTILDPDCASKTYPEYFAHLKEIGMVA